MPDPLRQSDAARFFVPLIFTAQMMMISHSIIHAFLARLPTPTITLAAFSATHALFSIVASPTVTTPLIALSYIHDRRSVHRQFVFNGLIQLGPFLFMQVVGWTSLGDWLFGSLLGVSPAVTRQARAAVIIFSLAMPPIMVRAVGFALLMRSRRTLWITYGTIVRLASLGGWLVILPWFMREAALGAAALVLCMTTETVYIALVAWPRYRELPPLEGPPASYGAMWRHSWPLMMGQVSENGVMFAVNIFLGRLANPDLALAAFGVVRGLLGLLLSPLRNLVQTAQTLVRTQADQAVMARFTLRVGVIFTVAVAVLFYTPLRRIVLGSVMGLTAELSAYCTPGLLVLLAVPLLWARGASTRGMLIAARRTGPIAGSSTLRVGAVVAVSSLTLLSGELNGALVGTAALAAGFSAEVAYLTWAMYRRYGVAALFPASEEPAAGAASPGA